MEKIGTKIKELREKKGLFQQDLANELHVTKGAVGMWETNKRVPDVETIRNIADYFKVSVDWLTGEDIEFDVNPRECEDATEIKCPICGYDYVHFQKTIGVNFNNEKSSGIAIKFRCEEGHDFYYVFESYKGNTYAIQTDDSTIVAKPINEPIYENAPVSLDKLWGKDQHEDEYIKKYRALDEHGKKIVDFVLDEEYKHSSEEQNEVYQTNCLVLTMYEDAVSAGTGEYLNDGRCVEVTVDETPLTERADFILRISGDSMEPTYHDGDKVLVESTTELNVGEIGIFVLNGQGYIKEYSPEGLVSHNKKYGIIRIGENDRCEVIGKVIGKI